jgi:hypothetical protein
VDIGKTPYERALREMLGKEKQRQADQRAQHQGRDPQAARGTGEGLGALRREAAMEPRGRGLAEPRPPGLATMLKKPVFRYLKGKVEFQRKRSGDVMTILLMLDDQTYWFFQYTPRPLCSTAATRSTP